MKNKLKLIVVSFVCLVGISYSIVSAGTNGLDLWMSGNNNNKVVDIQSQKHSFRKVGDVEVAFFSNSSFRVTSPKGISVLRFLFLLIKDGKTIINANTAETNKIKGIDCQPNNKPIPAINLASPKPIPSIFLKMK